MLEMVYTIDLFNLYNIDTKASARHSNKSSSLINNKVLLAPQNI